MFSNISQIYDRIVLGKPKLVLVLLFLIFAFFASFLQKFQLDASSDSLLLESDEDLRIFREVSERYETRDFLFVTFTPHKDLFSEEVLDQIKLLRDELSGLPRVGSVISILDVPLVKIIGGKLSDVAKNFRTLEDKSVDRAKAKEELQQSPIFQELIMSADAGTTALMLNLKINEEFSRLLKEKIACLLKEINPVCLLRKRLVLNRRLQNTTKSRQLWMLKTTVI